MESEKLAGGLGAMIAAVVLAAAFYYTPRGAPSVPATASAAKAEAPKGQVVQDITPAAPAVRGPVVKDITP